MASNRENRGTGAAGVNDSRSFAGPSQKADRAPSNSMAFCDQ